MKTPLFPFTDGRNFHVGDIINGKDVDHEGDAAQCRNPYRDYSGANPDIQFPGDFWHVKAGFGDLAGGFHQDLNRFEPWRVRVLRDTKKARNLIRLYGGGKGMPGGAELAHWFMPEGPFEGKWREVYWSEGLPILTEVTLRPSSRTTERLYFNIELRGLLSFKVKKNEPVEAFGLHLTSNFLKAKYWRDGYDGINVKERREIKGTHALRLDRWYRFRLLMTPILPENTWRVDATLRVGPETVWELHTGENDSPNGIIHISQITLGDEQEKNQTGGVWDVARAMCWIANTPDELAGEADEDAD